jgi:hypothetical protein
MHRAEDFLKQLMAQKEQELLDEYPLEQDKPQIQEILEASYNELYSLAQKQYKTYERTISSLEYKGSDFFTLLKIWKQWIKYHMQPEWANQHYLSADTLIEATNIRDELLEIAAKNGLNIEDVKTKDLEERIERTFISAFKYNLLVKQSNGSYTNYKLQQNNVRLHNSSVLLDDKPDFALAFEVIEINEIDSKPKLSARMLHAVDQKLIKQNFQHLFKKGKKEQKRFNRKKGNKGFRNEGKKNRRTGGRGRR